VMAVWKWLWNDRRSPRCRRAARARLEARCGRVVHRRLIAAECTSLAARATGSSAAS
jgi:hypothetical protein